MSKAKTIPMLKIALLGYGQMGRAIEALAQAAGDEVVLRIHSGNTEDRTAAALRAADVAIDFSRPDTAFGNISAGLRAGVPVVSGTTGWLDRMGEVQQLCAEQQGAFFYASNFSLGVNLFFALNERLAELMADWPAYELSIEEIHHTRKLDAPSGTAITLAQGLMGKLERKSKWENNPSQEADVLPIISKREPDVPGTHTIRYDSDIDFISITHEAKSRRGFVQGAVMAAQWVHGKKGYFEMKDLLKF